MACGTPVIAFDKGGVREIIDECLLVMSFKPCPTRSRRSAECRRLTARACGSDLKSASPLPAWRQTMFECIKRCSTAPEQAADPQTDSDAHRWRRLLPHGKQRRAGPRVGVFRAEDVSVVTSSVAVVTIPIDMLKVEVTKYSTVSDSSCELAPVERAVRL